MAFCIRVTLAELPLAVGFVLPASPLPRLRGVDTFSIRPLFRT